MSGQENARPFGDVHDKVVFHKEVLETLTAAQHLTPEDVMCLNDNFELKLAKTAGLAKFQDMVHKLAKASLTRKERGKQAVTAASVLGAASVAVSGAKGPAAASAPSCTSSDSSSSSSSDEDEFPPDEDMELEKPRARAVQDAADRALASFPVRSLATFPEKLRAYINPAAPKDYVADARAVVVVRRRTDLSLLPLTNEQAEDVIPGPPGSFFLKKGMTGEQMVEALKKRGEYNQLSAENKKTWLNMEPVEILIGEDCGYLFKTDVGALKRTEKNKRPQSCLILSAYESKYEIGLKVGSVVVIERYDWTRTVDKNTGKYKPIYVLQVVGHVDLDNVPEK